jgi:hypothetical protein
VKFFPGYKIIKMEKNGENPKLGEAPIIMKMVKTLSLGMP